MKNNKLFIVMCLILSNTLMYAQDTTAVKTDSVSSDSIKIKPKNKSFSLYFSNNIVPTAHPLGGKEQSFIVGASLTSIFYKNWGTSINYSQGQRRTQNYPAPDTSGPYETVNMYGISAVRRVPTSMKNLNFTLESGVFVAHTTTPTNFIYHSGGWFSSSGYTAQNEEKNTAFGVAMKANTNIHFGRAAGMHIGLFANIMEKWSYAGIDIGYSLGKFARNKKILKEKSAKDSLKITYWGISAMFTSTGDIGSRISYKNIIKNNYGIGIALENVRRIATAYPTPTYKGFFGGDALPRQKMNMLSVTAVKRIPLRNPKQNITLEAGTSFILLRNPVYRRGDGGLFSNGGYQVVGRTYEATMGLTARGSFNTIIKDNSMLELGIFGNVNKNWVYLGIDITYSLGKVR